MNRPAEVGGIAASIAFLIAALFGIQDTNVIVALGTVVGFIPAAITWIVVTVKGNGKDSPK